MIIKPIIIVE